MEQSGKHNFPSGVDYFAPLVYLFLVGITATAIDGYYNWIFWEVIPHHQFESNSTREFLYALPVIMAFIGQLIMRKIPMFLPVNKEMVLNKLNPSSVGIAIATAGFGFSRLILGADPDRLMIAAGVFIVVTFIAGAAFRMWVASFKGRS